MLWHLSFPYSGYFFWGRGEVGFYCSICLQVFWANGSPERFAAPLPCLGRRRIRCLGRGPISLDDPISDAFFKNLQTFRFNMATVHTAAKKATMLWELGSGPSELRVSLTRAGPVLRNFCGRPGEGPRLTRLLGIVTRNKK